MSERQLILNNFSVTQRLKTWPLYQIYQTYLTVCTVAKWFDAHGPDLIQQNSTAPHITGSGILAIVESFWSCPLHWDLATMRNIVVLILEIPRQTKVCNLQSVKARVILNDLLID